MGALEGTSKLFYSLALASLGREGILGRMQVGVVDGCRGWLARWVLGLRDWTGVCCPAWGSPLGSQVLTATCSDGATCLLPLLQRRVKAPGTFTEEAVEQMEEVRLCAH